MKLLNNKVKAAALVLTSALASSATAQETEIAATVAVDLVVVDAQAQEPAATTSEVVAASKEMPEDAVAYVEERARKFIESKRRKFQKQNKQVFMHSGWALVAVKPTESSWGDARTMAYVEAQQKAREGLLKQLYTSIATKTLRSSFNTNKMPEFTPEEIESQSKFEALIRKVVALADATVDSELRELGVDPEEYDAAPPTKRKTMMQKAITQSVQTASRGDLTGTQIMKSFEKTDVNGNTAIAVVIATSNKKKNFLASLYKSKGNIEPEPDKAKMSVEDYLDKNRENLMYQIGTKIHWDEKGYPVILSFGMAGNDCNPADYEECVDNREFSYLDAELSAFAHISEAYNLTGKVESSKNTTSGKTKTAKVTLNDSNQVETQQQTVSNLIREISTMSEVSSKVKGLVGLQQATRWSAKHPVTNREINGVVLMWHPLTEQDTRAFKAGKTAKKGGKNGAKVVYDARSGESDEADDEDF